MKYNIITTMKKLEQLIMHMESSSNVGVIGATGSVDQFIRDEDRYTLDTAILSRSPDFIPLLVRLFKMTGQSKLDRKVREALAVQGENIVEPLMGLLDTEHGPRAAMVLAEIGSPVALNRIIQLAATFPDFMNSAIKLAAKVGDQNALEFLVVTLADNKPYGFPISLMKKDENEGRIAISNLVTQALKNATSEDFRTVDEWSKWWSEKKES